jgi:lipopolysaccharide export system protein LptA
LQLKFTFPFFITLLLLVFSTTVTAQRRDTIAPLPHDTVRVIEIVKAKSLREKTIDSVTTIETASGNAVIKEGLTITYCDSVVITRPANIVEAFGNIHIDDNDSIHTYAQSLRYIGNERIAYLKKNVKLTDKKGVLLTDELEYNLRTGIATYKNGGRVINGKTLLTSQEGVYYSDTKDVYFKKNVHLVDPKYDIRTDSLIYNITNDIATFIAPTHIVTKDGGVIDTKSGTYNLKTGEAIFYSRTVIRDSGHVISGDKILSDEKTGIVQIDGRGKFVDSLNKVTVLGGHLELSRKENSFLAYNKPVMIIYKDNDSTYIAADTLFSGLRKYDSVQKKQVMKVDTLNKVTTVSLTKKDSAGVVITDKAKTDTIQKASTQKVDTLNKVTAVNITEKDSAGVVITDKARTDTIPKGRTQKADTIKKAMLVDLNKKDTAIRYFLGFHHVRIFNDSLQSVSDSLYYSTDDSTFKLFGHPLVWNGKTQIAGDTIYMHTENQKPKHLYVFYNGIIINQTADRLFNQIGGRTLNGYFKDGAIDYVRVKGSPAESIFYPQDDDSAYTGMNRSSGDVIDIFFVNKELNKVKFINNVDGVMYPLRQIPADKRELKNFKWLDSRRPKNKLELFE